MVLKRAVIVAIPAGAIIFILANLDINGIAITSHIGNFLDPFGRLIGLDGIIILAFLLALPANEIALPLMIMMYTMGGTLASNSLGGYQHILIDNGWTIFTAINVLLFSLLHFPCSTTLLTIYKETKSIKWTFVSFILPTITAIIVCLFTSFIFSFF